MQPVSYKEAETLVSMRSSRTRPWGDTGRMERQMSARGAEPENVDRKHSAMISAGCSTDASASGAGALHLEDYHEGPQLHPTP